MRVYELAKKIGIENRELIPELKRMGIPVTSHSSALDEATVEKVLDQLSPKNAKSAKGAGKGSESLGDSGKRSEARKTAKQSRISAGTEESGGGGRGSPRTQKPSAPVTEEPPKPDKRRILIKRKKTEEEEAAAQPEEGMIPVPAPVGSGAEPSVTFPSPTGAEEVKAPSPQEPTVHPAPAESHVAHAGRVLPSSAEQVTRPESLSAAGSQTMEAAPAESEEISRGKKKGVPVEPIVAPGALGKDKLKKTKKLGRVREADDLRFREDAARWQDLRAIPVHRREDRSRHAVTTSPGEVTKPRKKGIKITPGVTVKEFAELVGQRPADVIRKLMEMGQMLTMNQPIDSEAAVLIAEGSGLRAEISAEKEGEALLKEALGLAGAEHLEPRPPVVTIMGHVDHGKTSLLDAIRQTKVTEQEAGGITQHIGAYTVQVNGKRIAFLDTPGHEAFTAMRARGAQVTDAVVLVVAADDGVMPQTLEAINHATAGNVPIIVAINKIDKPGSNVDRVKHALAEHNLIPEAWGGQTIFVEVSAKEKIGLDTLLEMILLQAEVLELKVDPHGLAKGTVIEAKLDKGRGPVATVLVQSGTLRVGDAFLVGSFSGRVRALVSDIGTKITEAGPSTPVEVIGLPGVPSAGDEFLAVVDEKVAREIAQSRLHKQRIAELASMSPRVSLDDLFSQIKEGEVKELSLVIKSDVQGSAEAVTQAVEKLSSPLVKLRVLHRGVGGITETDVMLATSSQAIIIGFNVRPEPKAAALAEKQGIDIRLYTVIYDAIADIKAAMEGLLEPTLKERSLGRAEVRQIFTIPKAGVVAGCYVLDGTISRASAGVRVIRDHVTVYEGKLGSLRRFKDDVREVQQGYECGISVENFNDLKVGDILEVFVHDKVTAKL